MRPLRTAKAAAGRIDPTYITRPRNPIRSLRGTLIVACTLGAIVWVLYAGRDDQALYSPGRLAPAHALWENDCTQCHEPEPRGARAGFAGFARRVTDHACLRCHDAAIHHPNQKAFITWASADTAAGGAADAGRSERCTACHVEHRGHEKLLARRDAYCLQCHANLPSAAANGAPKVAPVVTAFRSGAHPPFGRELTASKQWSPTHQALVDPTPLNFKHSRHMARVKAPPGQAENCGVCHQPASAGDNGGARRDMKPVSYAEHCAACHKLELVQGSGVPVPHERLELIRPLLREYARDLEGHLRRSLEAMPEEKRHAALVKTVKVMSPPPPKEHTVLITPEDWATDKAAAAWAPVKQWYEKVIEADGQRTAPASSSPTPWKDPRAVEFYVTHAQSEHENKCSLCHALSDDADAVARLREQLRSAAAPVPPTTRPDPAPLSTLPTGFKHVPRRWFAHSVFNHDAHRSMSCLDCHAAAKTSEKTSDVLIGGLETCVKCHYAPKGGDRGAGADCQTCHVFHDRTLERAGGSGVSSAEVTAGATPHPPFTR